MEIVYNKLVRDLIPDIIKADGKTPVISAVKDKTELRNLFITKLGEEIAEYGEKYSLEELADVLEVLHALITIVHGEEWEKVEQIRQVKRAQRGGFEEGIMLEKVID